MQIADFIAQAEQRLSEGKLLEPPQNNADYYFRQALLLDQGNARAQEGLHRVLLARIDGYLQRAEQRLVEDRLLLPEDDSAAFYFRQVLAWQPDNLLALAGINRIAQRFIEQSQQAYGRREYRMALEYIKQGLEVEPANETLLDLYDAHERRVQLAQAPRVPASKPARRANSSQNQGTPNPIKRLWNNIFNK
jgi:hypothetical protein